MNTVAIVGTGLIGASFGLALKRAGFAGRVIGVSSEQAIGEAMEAGAINCGAPLAEAVGQADLVFLSQSIGRILDTIRHLDSVLKPGSLVTDAGSTKTEVVDLARQFIRRGQFLGGHPMAGKETRGAGAAEAGLFQGRTWVLTPDEPAELETATARDLRGWLRRIGARLVILNSDEHDRVVAFTSHLAQLASTALSSTVAENLTREGHLRVAGPGLADMTRLALSSYDLWRDILATNSEQIDRALARYIQELEHIRENLRTRELQQEFARGAELATKLRRPG